MTRWIKRTLGRIAVRFLWGSLLQDDGLLTIIDADGQEYEWVQSIGDWEPVTIEATEGYY